MENQSAYTLIAFCPWCGEKLVWVETGIDDIKSCPKFMTHTVSINREFSKDRSLLTLNITGIPPEELPDSLGHGAES